jgi:hypothetical protein
MPRLLALLTISVLWSSSSAAQITVLDSFDPSDSGGLCGLGLDPITGDVWVHQCNSDTVEGYASDGTFLRTIPRPGESANDVDIDFAPEAMTLDETLVPEGTLLFINGESGPAEVYAIDVATGLPLDTLNAAFGISHVVGGGYDALRDVFVLVQDRVPGGTDANRIADVDPLTGEVLNSFQTVPDYDVNFGDLDVSSVTGHLFVVSSSESGIGEFTPDGEFVTTHALPSGVSSLSGIALDCEVEEAWVANTSGSVWRLGAVPCGSTLSAEETASPAGLALSASYPNPFADQTTVHVTLDRTTSVEVTVYDLLGRRIRTLTAGQMTTGTHPVVWDGTDDGGLRAADGLYFLRLSAPGVSVTRGAVRIR